MIIPYFIRKIKCLLFGHKPVYSIADDNHIVAVCSYCKSVLLYYDINRDSRAGCFFRKDK